MATIPTKNPIPSEAPRDLKFNAGKIDEVVNSDNLNYIDRFGISRLTIEGIRNQAQQAISSFGYITIDSFEAGATLTLPNQALRYQSTGEYYRWGGALPKTVPSGSSPLSSGGIGVNAWVAIGDAALRQNLSSSDPALGDNLIKMKQPTANSAALTIHENNLQVVSIQHYGSPRAKDDYDGTSGTNSWSALQAIITDFPNGCIIRFPRTIGGTGRYFMSGTGSSSDMSKYVIDADEGVDVTHTGAGTPLIGPGLVVRRPLSIRLVTLGYTYTLSATAYGKLAGKPYSFTYGDGESPFLERLITSSADFYFNTVSLSTGAQSQITPAGADGEIASFNNISATGFTVGSVPIRPGQEIHAQMTMPGMTGEVAGYVLTEGGWVLISQNLTGGNYTRRIYLQGNAIQTATINDPLADNPAYNAQASEIGIKVHSPTSFSLLMNHTEVMRIENLTSNIVRAGWGAGMVNNTNPAYITYPVKVRNNKTYGMRPLKIVTVGDSTADYSNPFSWVNHMTRSASGAGGLQFKTVLNQAISGQTAVQQASIFNNTNFQALGGFDYALIDVGINDIGGGSTSDNFISAIVSMINTCTTYNIIPIIGVPAMFYNQSAASTYGQTGQNSSNADRGAPYRLKLLRKLAELNVQVAMLPIQDMGAVVPSLITSGKDPVVQDNVHPSAWGAELKGQGWAKAFVGYLFQRVRTDITSRTINAAWIPTAIAATYGLTAKPSFQVTGNEFGLTGLMDTPASVPDQTILLQLPQCYAPKAQMYIPLTCQDGSGNFLQSVATARIDTTGAIVVRGVPSTSRYLFFGNIHYTLQQ